MVVFFFFKADETPIIKRAVITFLSLKSCLYKITYSYVVRVMEKSLTVGLPCASLNIK